MANLKMYDCEGTELKKGDFVQLTIGKAPYINRAMKKGYVFKVSYCEDRSFTKDEGYIVIFLCSKTGNRLYQSGVTSKEILKVNYDLKKKKIIKGDEDGKSHS